MTLQVSDAREDSLLFMLTPLPNIEKLSPISPKVIASLEGKGNSLQMGIE